MSTPTAFDTTLADLIENIEVARVDGAALPVRVTITMDADTLRAILTCASLHMTDKPFQPLPVDPNYELAGVVAANNTANQYWHWQMEDAIEFLIGRISKAVRGELGRDNDKSISRERQSRLFDQAEL